MFFNFQKSTKKVDFAALLKQKFYFVPRGTIVENFFNIDAEEESEKEFVFHYWLCYTKVKIDYEFGATTYAQE